MISEELKRLCEVLRSQGDGAPEEAGPYVSVEQLTGRFGVLYEKLRSLVDYKEYHLIRQSAIRRMLKRQLYIERKPNSGAALLRELVSSGYLPNNRVPEAKAIDVQNIIRKSMAFERGGLTISLSLDFASIEIERFLFPEPLKDALLDSFFHSSLKAVVYQGKDSVDHARITYAACRRSLFAEDKPNLLYALAIQAIPELFSYSLTDPAVATLAPRLLANVRTSEEVAKHALVWKVSSRLKNHALYYAVLLEIINSYGKGGAEIMLDDDAKLKEYAESIIEKKQKQQRKLLRISGRRAVIYLLLTKILLGIALEWPYEQFILRESNYIALGTNALFHPILLFLMVTFVRKENRGAERVIEGVSAVVHGKDMKQMFIKPPSSMTTFFFVLCFYLLLFAASFGVILWGLIALGFNAVSIMLFFVFLTLVSYFGLRIRGSAKRWEPVSEKKGTLGLIWNLFVFPIVRQADGSARGFQPSMFVFLLTFR